MTGQPLASPGPSTRFIGCRADFTGPTSIADTTFTTVDLTTLEPFADPDNFHDLVTNPSRFTIPAGLGGLYEIVGHAAWTGNSSGSRMIRLLKNGATGLQDAIIWNAGGTDATRFQCIGLDLLVPGDFIQMQVRQTSGSALNLDAARLMLTLKGGLA